MIQNKTARALLYSWHSGQWSPFYAAASSGLVDSFMALSQECMAIDEPDRARLHTWITRQALRAPKTVINGVEYSRLSWAKERE